MLSRISTIALIAAFVVFGNAKPLIIRRDVDWQSSSDDNLTSGCSRSQISCYNDQKLADCDAADYQCMCDAMANAIGCLDDCNNGNNAYIAKQAQSVYCEAASIYGSSSRGSDSNGDGDGEDDGSDDAGNDSGETTTESSRADRPTTSPEVTFRGTTTSRSTSTTGARSSAGERVQPIWFQTGGVRTSLILAIPAIAALLFV